MIVPNRNIIFLTTLIALGMFQNTNGIILLCKASYTKSKICRDIFSHRLSHFKLHLIYESISLTGSRILCLFTHSVLLFLVHYSVSVCSLQHLTSIFSCLRTNLRLFKCIFHVNFIQNKVKQPV